MGIQLSLDLSVAQSKGLDFIIFQAKWTLPAALSGCDICLVLLPLSLMVPEGHRLSLKPIQVSSGTNYPTSVILRVCVCNMNAEGGIVLLGSWWGFHGLAHTNTHDLVLRMS